MSVRNMPEASPPAHTVLANRRNPVTSSRPFRFGAQGFIAESAATWRSMVREAEQLGFSTFHVADHYFGPGPLVSQVNHPVQNLAAIPAMAVAAEATETIRIGSRVLCVDYHQPAVLAKEAATIDLLSGGRLELGLGAGWIEAEYRAMGIRWDPAGTRIDRLIETVELIKAHFSGQPIDVRGSHVTVSGYAGSPLPVQLPHPPIMIGGGGRRVLTSAARIADIVSVNFNNRAGRIGAEGVGSSGADQTAEKITWIREGAGDRFASLELELAVLFPFITNHARETAERVGAAFGLDAEATLNHPYALIGTVGDICDRLIERREIYGISYITLPAHSRIPGASALADFAPLVERLSGK